MTEAQTFSDTACALGEGPLWHPEREQLFWFDILGKRLLTRTQAGEHHWQFDECVSAAGWADRDILLIASETGLYRFEIETGHRDLVIALEAENPVTRSNDGRVDPWGGFWIGTMGYDSEPKAGAIYRWYRGELRKLVDAVTISNAICFAPDKSCAYFTDTADGRILRQPLQAADGWPDGEAQVFLDFRNDRFCPDGAVVDADGCLWSAQWGAGRVARYDPDGRFLSAVTVPTPQTSCPAFGGADLTTLYITTAAVGVDQPPAGQTFEYASGIVGQREHRIIL